MREERKCVYCGMPYIATRRNAKYCSDICRRIETLRNAKVLRDKAKDEKAMKMAKQRSIIDLAKEAKNAGLTYGQYVAKMGL